MDASVALAWCFPDENDEYAERVLQALGGKTVLIPSLWAVELANGLVVGEKRKRLGPADVRRFLALLEGLTILQDVPQPASLVTSVLPLARKHGLTAYDAAYLELAAREAAPLATLDSHLRRAARSAGIAEFAAA